MILKQFCSYVKLILLSLIGIFRRALCCFSRRRRSSMLDECDNLEAISVVTDYKNPQKRSADNERDWNSWDDSPRTVEEHIEQYRQKLAKPSTPTETEPEPDFFQDMTPKIKPQTVLYIKKTEDQQKTDFSRLEAKLDVPIPVSPELEDWTDGNGGWEELNPEETKQLIREKRKELRSQRKQQQQQQQQQNKQNSISIQRIQDQRQPLHQNFPHKLGIEPSSSSS